MDWNTAWQWLQSFGGVISATVIAAAVSYPVWLPNLKEFFLKAIDKRFVAVPDDRLVAVSVSLPAPGQ